ncbi:MAG: LacI family DNA-binding transcriptional regulator [Bacteroidales bacterium]|nr:LacI family DNA-binding transcriptional regulator [Bacteroidales bacterium]HPO66320.1 LacI family DNA-binding transcriptional regulator [Bacteroidales bacterium]
MRSSQTTIKDIAARLGISPSTVSRALKDHPDIGIETKRAVRELAIQLNYKPNALAISLRNSRSNIIGVIIPEIVHYFFSTVISGIEDVAYEAGYQVMVCQSNELYQHEVKNTQALLLSRIEGLLVSVSKETRDFSHLRNLQSVNIPIVFFDRAVDEIPADRVIVDDFEGAYRIVKHMIEMGCRRIAHLGTVEDLAIGRNRLNGYLKALKDHNIPIDEKLIVRSDTMQSAQIVTKRLVYELNPPDGIFAVNDLTAIGALQTIKECKLRVPEDICVAGFGNGLYSEITDPPITTVDQNGYRMGQIAMNLLLDRLIRKEPYPYVTEVLETNLIIRKSTQRPMKPQPIS